MAPGPGYILNSPLWMRAGRWLVMVVAMGVFAWLYLTIGAHLLAQTNITDKDILGADQKHNMKLALRTRADLSPDWSRGVTQPIQDWFPHRTDGVVNPLWPWVAAWFADQKHEISGDTEVTAQDREFFNRGRWFHVGWTLGGLIVLGYACLRRFTLVGSLVIVLLTGFGSMLPRAAYFQPEPIYFAFFALTWMACMMALHRNSQWMHALIGVFGGLAYLAKGSVQPLLMVYVAVSTLRWVWGWVETFRRRDGGEGTTLWLRRNHVLGMLVMACAFLLTAGPRLSYSWQTFGSPFHSFPGYWMWFDKFEDCYAWMGTHNTKESLSKMTAEERPSLTNYAATHTRQQMWERLRDGTATKLTELFWPGYTTPSKKGPKPWKGVLELRGVYLGVLIGLLITMALALRLAGPRPEHAAHRVHPETMTHLLFVVGAFVGYSLAYGWYTPIGRGDRFMLSLYAPLVISMVWASEALLRRAMRRGASVWFHRGYLIVQSLLVMAIAWRLIEIMRFPVFKN